MNKAVLISIQPKWCELIANGKKTVEVRKTKPKLETPFKVYIYATEPRHKRDFGLCLDDGKVGLIYRWNYDYALRHKMPILSGKVIGEFVCDGISEQIPYKWREGGFECLNWKYNSDFSEISCVTQDELMRYGNRKTLYGWHITDLVIYDKPKELSEFYRECNGVCVATKNKVKCERIMIDGFSCNGLLPLKRPPQSWMFVEEK